MPDITSLTVEVSLKTGASPVGNRTIDKLKKIIHAYLTHLDCKGNWKGQVGCREINQTRLEPSSVRFTGIGSIPNAIQTHVCTDNGQKFEIVLTGPIPATEMIARIGSNKTFVLKPETKAVHSAPQAKAKAAPNERNIAVPVSQDDIGMFMMLFQQHGGSVLKKEADSFCATLQGDVVKHCLETSLIVADGSAAYTITESGRGFLPVEEVAEVPAHAKPLDLSALKREIEEMQAILAPRKELEARIANLKRLADSAENDFKQKTGEMNRREAELEKIRNEVKHKRDQTLAAQKSLLNAEAGLQDPKFKEAADRLDELKKIINDLAASF